MKILKEEIPILLVYALVFIYAIAIHFFHAKLPLSPIAVPLALTLFIVFLIHMTNILIRG